MPSLAPRALHIIHTKMRGMKEYDILAGQCSAPTLSAKRKTRALKLRTLLLTLILNE